MYRESKPMLSPSELINHLESKGVKFELISKEDAQKYLKDNNNFFKLVSYRKNFPKYENGDNEGKYINLDFKMLVELSILDMRIRKNMLSIVLDLEHYAKVKLLSEIENTSNDGYSIVEEYMDNLKSKGEYEYLESELNKNKKSTYCGELVSKYANEYPVWVFLEVIPFGRLIKFYRFVAEKFSNRKMLDESYMLMDVRELRNACAHNNCIINDLRANTCEYRPSFRVLAEVAKIGISKKVRDNKLSNPRIKQLVTLLHLNKSIVTSAGIFNHQKSILGELVGRIEHHIDYFDTNELVQSSLKFLNKIIDSWYTNSI